MIYEIQWLSETREEARAISKYLVENKLASCINIAGSVESYFYWEGAVQSEEEILVYIKTADEHVDMVIDIIAERSSYDVPAVIAYPIEKGYRPYLRWVAQTK